MRYRWAIVILAVGLIQILFATTAGAVAEWVTETSKPRVVKEVSVPGVSGSHCPGEMRAVHVYGLGEVGSCVYGGGPELAFYYDSTTSSMRHAVRKGLSTLFYPVEGICQSNLRCQYSSETDRMVTQEYGPNYLRWLVSYDNFVEKLVFQTQPSPRFVFEARPPDYRLTTANEGVLSTASFTLSHDGREVAVEARNKGILLVDLDKEEGRRVVAPGRQYGYGLDPTYEIALSRDKKTLAISGSNAGFTLMSLTDTCGEPIPVQFDQNFPSGTIRCRWVESEIFTSIPDLYQVRNPKFDSTDQYLTVEIRRYNNSTQLMTIAPAEVSPPPHADYLSMGDSFTSGEGELSDEYYRSGTNEEDEKCHVSSRSYPFRIATSRQWDHVGVACSGARLTDITGPGYYYGQFDRLKGASDFAQKQTEALKNSIPGRVRQGDFIAYAQPERVSIGIGGNDSGILDKVKACAAPGECRWTDESLRQAVAEEIDALLPRYVETFRAVKSKMNGGAVYAVGYPLAVNPNGECDTVTKLLFSEKERQLLYHSIKRLNRVMYEASQQANILFIDTEDAFVGTELCGSTDSSSMNGVRFGNEVSVGKLRIIGSESYHPTPAGHARLQPIIENTLASGETFCRSACELSDEPDAYWNTEQSQDQRQYRATALSAANCSVICRISIAAGTLKPYSQVEVVLHSDPVRLGAFTVNEDGGVQVEVRLPSDIPEGYHTLAVQGELFDGRSAVLYQALATPMSTSELEVTSGLVVKKEGHALPSRPSLAPSQNREAPEVNLPVGGKVLGAADSPNKIATIPISPMSRPDIGKTTFDWTVLLWVLTGIIMLWLLYVLLLRRLFRPVFSEKSNPPVT